MADPPPLVKTQELTELEQELEESSDRFFKSLKLVVIDSLGAVFAPIIGGSLVAHSLLVSIVQLLQVTPHAACGPLAHMCMC